MLVLRGLNLAAGKTRKRVGEFRGGGMKISHTWSDAKLLPPTTTIRTPPSLDCESIFSALMRGWNTSSAFQWR